MRRAAASMLVLALLAIAVPATANVPDSFTACGSDSRTGECTGLVDIGFGQTVYLKGKVDPPHADLTAGVWHKGPFEGDVWERWATVEISATGLMRYRWETTQADGAQESPHFVQFRIKGHGVSNRVKVRVWLGE